MLRPNIGMCGGLISKVAAVSHFAVSQATLICQGANNVTRTCSRDKESRSDPLSISAEWRWDYLPSIPRVAARGASRFTPVQRRRENSHTERHALHTKTPAADTQPQTRCGLGTAQRDYSVLRCQGAHEGLPRLHGAHGRPPRGGTSRGTGNHRGSTGDQRDVQDGTYG